MDDSINHGLIDGSEHGDGDHYLCFKDDDTDESHCMYVILSGTARLNVLLPKATILSFTIFAPPPALFSHSLIALYYGVATFRGIWTFNGGRKRPCVPSDYRLRWADLFRASLSLVAFLTFAGSHNDVVGCYYPAMPKRITNNLPLVVGFVVSFLFVLFPSKRRGIDYPFLLMRGALYSRRSKRHVLLLQISYGICKSFM
ncbi:hypothetical protein RchiOBHm_Chr6g0272661 [Rosa chinensis]|uniref:Uncharacterized protein n=1 Tax=Rosa chinensis TaxID=74649 RepID=A0A2P6PRA9_ROSCH|nr:hypothetical protein RchiOBHm_Chr6g0272661 [Rosa chinensis]